MTQLRPLTRESVRPLLDLQVLPAQSTFVGSNAVTMGQAHFEPGTEIYGIWDNDVAVGMMAIIDMSHPEQAHEDADSLYIWRFMIGANHQGHGHGNVALNFAIDLARKKQRTSVSLTSVDAEGCAIPFYERNGFRRTGKIIDGEAQLILHLTESL